MTDIAEYDREWSEWEYYEKVTGLHTYMAAIDYYSHDVVDQIRNSFESGQWTTLNNT